MESNSKLKGKSGKVKALFCMILCFGLLAFSFQPAKAQTFDEWFAQSKTQIKYLVQQIAALNAFEASVRQGYNELKSDWTAIGNWKSGEYTLHVGYYNSLNQVNPVVLQTADNATIQAQQQSIISQFAALLGLDGLTADERAYVTRVQQAVLMDCAQAMDELRTVLTPGTLVLSDDERIKRVAKVADEVQDQYEFTCHFAVQVHLLAAQRGRENNDLQNLLPLYGND
ncbi:MAG: hypothetical protein JST32_15515 [Bacteroidetes bacterium]|nr:hypothetical protein [Bacteroidota bacterium]